MIHQEAANKKLPHMIMIHKAADYDEGGEDPERRRRRMKKRGGESEAEGCSPQLGRSVFFSLKIVHVSEKNRYTTWGGKIFK